MSVRRLAEDSIQPASFAFSPEFSPQVDTWIGKYPEGREQSAVIPLLMLAQEQEGWVTRAAIEHVADRLGMPLIRVLEVATFYTQFQLAPVGTRAHVQVCGTTPCMLMGAEKLKDVCRSRIHHDQFHRNAAGTLSWEEVECLGACVNAPMVIIGKDAYEDLTPERLEEIIAAFEAGRGDSIPTGPQNGRMVSAPKDGLTTLKEEIVASHWRNGSAEVASDVSGATSPSQVPPASQPAPPAAGPASGSATTSGPATRDAGAAGDATRAAKPDGYEIEGDRKLRKPGTKDRPAGAEQERSEAVAAAKAASPERDATDGDADTSAAGSSARKRPAGRTPSGDNSPTQKSPIDVDRPLAAPVGVPTAPDGESVSGPVGGAMRPDEGAASAVVAKGGKAADMAPPSLDAKERPRAIERPETPDDLQMIAGIGPKNESILHSIGIWTWAQIAAWTVEEQQWVNSYLRFRGRIEREEWVRQADALARGGREEYIRVFGKDPV